MINIIEEYTTRTIQGGLEMKDSIERKVYFLGILISKKVIKEKITK